MAAGTEIESPQQPGTFYVCTETSPRCYIIQQVSAFNVNRVRGRLNDSDDEEHIESQQVQETPPTPSLPSWFTVDCEKKLSLCADAPIASYTYAPTLQILPSNNLQPLPSAIIYLQPEQIKEQLRKQLEYYFSRENLMSDRFLRSQMDNDSYVPIQIIADFPRVKQLTSDYNFLVQVLRESPRVQVDEKGERVRAVSKRCTIILRDIPPSTDEKEVASLFNGAPPYLRLHYGLNNSWYVIFESEEATQRAYLHLQNVKTFNNKPICARIKAGGAPCSEPMISFERPLSSLSVTYDRPASVASADHSEVTMRGDRAIHYAAEVTSPSNEDFDLGKILSGHGYIPQSVYLAEINEVRAFTINTSNPNRVNVNRLRTNGRTGYYRGSYHNRNTHGQQMGDVGQYRKCISKREYSNTNYRNQHYNSRRGNADFDANFEETRDRSTDYQQSYRGNRLNSFSSQRNGISVRNRSYGDASAGLNNHYSSFNDYDHRQKQTLTVESSLTRPRKVLTVKRASRSPAEDKECVEDYNSSSPCNDDSKSEASSKKTEELEYNFEENAFPSLSEEVKEESVKEEKPLFSKVAAGKRKDKKDAKERRSYAQMLKQGNGYFYFFLIYTA